MLTAAVTSLLAGHLADHYGHLNIVMAGALVFATGTALEAGSSSLPMLLVGRALAGFGEGLYLGNLNVYAIICHVTLLVLNESTSYICEIAPKAKRGMLVSMPQLLVTAGMCVGYFTCYGSIKLDSSISWRLPFIIQAIGGVLLSIFCYILPSSPRWMLLHGHRDTAMSALKRLDVSTVEIEKDILRPAEDAARSQSASTGLRGLLVIFERQHRTRTALGLFILGMLMNWLVGFATPIFLARSSSGPYFLFGSLSLTTVIVLAIYMPETRGESLETIQEAFHRPPLRSWATPSLRAKKQSQQGATIRRARHPSLSRPKLRHAVSATGRIELGSL
ncbi:MAG: hypothetical protein Q9163_005113 [Psora crenata]